MTQPSPYDATPTEPAQNPPHAQGPFEPPPYHQPPSHQVPYRQEPYQQAPYQPGPTGPVPVVPSQRGFPRWAWITILVAVLLMFVAAGGIGLAVVSRAGGGLALGSTPLETARDNCAKHSGGVAIQDDGRTLVIDTKGEEESSGATSSEFTCVIDALEVPGAVRAKIGNTRALDGMVTAEWDDYSASWNYHPANGINMVISMT